MKRWIMLFWWQDLIHILFIPQRSPLLISNLLITL